MSERQVREVGRAYDQRASASERRIRELQSRAYRGAVRTASADAADPGLYNDLVSVLEVVVPSGRWLATGFATFAVTPVATVDLYAQIVVSDPLTDDEFTGPNYDLPPARYAATLATPLVMSLRCGGDLIAEDNVKVTLRTMNADGDAYTLTDLRLALNPV